MSTGDSIPVRDASPRGRGIETGKLARRAARYPTDRASENKSYPTRVVHAPGTAPDVNVGANFTKDFVLMARVRMDFVYEHG